jgi:ribosome-associated heat shock protein Hsp15
VVGPERPSLDHARGRLEGSPAAVASRAILERVTDPQATDETRIDRWLCAVRLVKTRPMATRLCEGGHVVVNGSPAKPSTKVRARDLVEADIADRKRVVEVVRPIESRVAAPVAATCYVDHSPPVVRRTGSEILPIRGEGRPSKRLRRELERLRRAGSA